MIGMTYVDVMDRERHIRPVKDMGKEWLCEVFWHSEGRSVAGGRIAITKKLFDQSDYGFIPWVAEQQPSLEQTEER